MIRFALLLAALTACSKDNPYFCDDQCQPEPDAGSDSGSNACATNADCDGATPVCDTTQSACVPCTATDIGACAGATPVCVAATNTCAPCAAHDECSSDACLPTGECGTDASVAYVAAAGTDAGTCTKQAPCATLTFAASKRPYVKLQSNVDEAVVFDDVTTTVLAEPGTTIKRTASNGAIITLTGNTTVTLTDVIIRDAATATGHGILVGAGESGVTLTLDQVAILQNTGFGLSVSDGTLNMSRCVVSNNFAGGANITGAFEITNTLFVTNGTNSSVIGGLQLAPGAGKKIFSFNTVADNDSSNTVGRGINCAFPMTVTNTLLSNNAPNGCTFDYSMYETALSGTNNKTGNPQFKNTLATAPLAPDYFRIANNSDAIDGAAPSSSVMTDIDGDDRPQGGVRDIGADEFK